MAQCSLSPAERKQFHAQILFNSIFFRTQQAIAWLSAALVLQKASSFNHHINLNIFNWYGIFYLYFSASLYYRANNIFITVAEMETDLFYSGSTGDQKNICGYIEGQLDASEYIRCHSVISGRFVQVQNNIFAGESFHLAEVEVFGV